MNKLPLLLVLVLLSGCATYKYEHGKGENANGYVVSRDQYPILEYTVGPNNAAPTDLNLAKDRFKRRHRLVEHYYKQMGYIESRVKQIVWDYPAMTVKVITGVFRMPFKAMDQHKYDTDPAYRQKSNMKEAQEEAQEDARLAQIKGKLAQYIQLDLRKEELVLKEKPAPSKVVEAPKAIETPEAPEAPKAAEVPEAPVTPEIPAAPEAPAAAETPAAPVAAPAVETPAVPAAPAVETPAAPEAPVAAAPAAPVAAPAAAPSDQAVSKALDQVEYSYTTELAKKSPPMGPKARVLTTPQPKAKKAKGTAEGRTQAIIYAKPVKGYSPLKVNFSAAKSYSTASRIISYSWDFGDGDTSSKASCTNTFWSTTLEPKYFTVTLTVTDANGQASVATQTIEVINP